MGSVNLNWNPRYAFVNPEKNQIPKYDNKSMLRSSTPDMNETDNNVIVNIDYFNKKTPNIFVSRDQPGDMKPNDVWYRVIDSIEELDWIIGDGSAVYVRNIDSDISNGINFDYVVHNLSGNTDGDINVQQYKSNYKVIEGDLSNNIEENTKFLLADEGENK